MINTLLQGAGKAAATMLWKYIVAREKVNFL